MHHYGGLAAPLAALAVVALALGAVALPRRSRWRCVRGCAAARRCADALLFAASGWLAELARGVLFTGFPWVATGYGQIDGPLAALAPWIGVYGIGFVTAACCGAAGVGISAPAGAALAALAAGRRGAAWRPPRWPRATSRASSGRLAVTLVQTNVAQDEKFAPERLPEALAVAVGRAAAARAGRW